MKRIFHQWNKWECYSAGFYESHPPKGMSKDDAEQYYRDFLSDIPLFEKNMKIVITTWINSCEHYLTNDKMNRIAWMGQAAICVYNGIPSQFRGGYNLLDEKQKIRADKAALKYINKWFAQNGYDILSENEIKSKHSTSNIY